MILSKNKITLTNAELIKLINIVSLIDNTINTDFGNKHKINIVTGIINKYHSIINDCHNAYNITDDINNINIKLIEEL